MLHFISIVARLTHFLFAKAEIIGSERLVMENGGRGDQWLRTHNYSGKNVIDELCQAILNLS